MKRAAVSRLVNRIRRVTKLSVVEPGEPDVARELASHCAVLTLELEKVCKQLKAEQDENAKLRKELTQQRRVAKVIAMPARL
jgi:phosphoribosylaminoimidazole carboxylase (NCAIR synthetase)